MLKAVTKSDVLQSRSAGKVLISLHRMYLTLQSDILSAMLLWKDLLYFIGISCFMPRINNNVMPGQSVEVF